MPQAAFTKELICNVSMSENGVKYKQVLRDVDLPVLAEWEAHIGIISCVKAIRENKTLVTGSHDKLIKIWVNVS